MNLVYLAGPMTGYPEHNYPAFHAAAARLRQLGHAVVNPAELNPTTDKAWDTYLRQDLAALLECSEIAVLPGWVDSRGARLEVHVATELGMEVRYASVLETESAHAKD